MRQNRYTCCRMLSMFSSTFHYFSRVTYHFKRDPQWIWQQSYALLNSSFSQNFTENENFPSLCLFLLFFPLLIRDEKTWGSAVKVENSLTYYVVISATDGRLARSSSVSLSILGNLEFIQKVQRSLDKMELLRNLIKVKWKSGVYVCKQLT